MKRKASALLALIVAMISFTLPACSRTHAEDHEGGHEEQNKVVVTSPEARDVVITQPYVCQIRAKRYTEIRALEEGYLEEIDVKEGQAVKEKQVMFRVLPVLYKAKLEAERAEAKYAEIKLRNAKRLNEQKIVSDQDVALNEAELAKAEAKVRLAEAELNFTEVKAPFDGIMDRLYQMQGSLVKKEDLLTNLSDNSVMWVYFNVPEARYLEYEGRQAEGPQGKRDDSSRLHLADSRVELVLANGSKFPYSPGNTVTVEGKFNNETGNIAFRADFPNPDRLLRHGQTGTIRILRTMHNATVIPQRAAFEVLDKQYVWVVGEDHVVHRRPITIEHELEDIFVIKSGLELKDKIILEGVRQVQDGQKLEDFEFEKLGEALKHQKQHAE
jgi:membrane fusion protein (multidrug efflux system)